jgi:hypothetical protein
MVRILELFHHKVQFGHPTGYYLRPLLSKRGLRSALHSFSPGLTQSVADYPVITFTVHGNAVEYVMTEDDDGWGYRVPGEEPDSDSELPCLSRFLASHN